MGAQRFGLKLIAVLQVLFGFGQAGKAPYPSLLLRLPGRTPLHPGFRTHPRSSNACTEGALIATSQFSLGSRARYTSPISPAPNGRLNLVRAQSYAGGKRPACAQ